MKTLQKTIAAASGTALLMFSPSLMASKTTTAQVDLKNHTELTVEGPFSHKNLSLFLIKGKSKHADLNIITLAEAMEEKVIKVIETGNVQQLSVINLSKDKHIFIHSGDIVKGGKQDRTLTNSMLVPPGKTVPIQSFCVEQGRWAKRGKESLQQFNAQTKSVVSKKLKIAASLEQNQGEVWKEVAKAKAKLATSTGIKVADQRSASSLQLALENKKLQATVKEYVDQIKQQAKGVDTTLGYAFAINGKFNSADIYINHDVFTKLWQKRLEAAATEAVSEAKKKATYKLLSSTDIATSLAKFEDQKQKEHTTKRDLAAGNAANCRVLHGKLQVTNDLTIGDKTYCFHSNFIESEDLDPEKAAKPVPRTIPLLQNAIPLPNGNIQPNQAQQEDDSPEIK